MASVSALGLPSCIVGDFNVLLNESEKKGGGFVETSAIKRFREVLQINSLVNLGYVMAVWW